MERLDGMVPPLASFPLTTFEDYRVAIDESIRTGVSTLNGEDVIYFTKSSGSSGEAKYFPLTRTFERQLYEGIENIAPAQRSNAGRCIAPADRGGESVAALAHGSALRLHQ
jgi:phenylacetate-coenzyme A ligase PaaK-like adenylate-forming protein